MAKKQMVVLGIEKKLARRDDFFFEEDVEDDEENFRNYVHCSSKYLSEEFEFVARGAQFPYVNKLLEQGWRVVSVTPQTITGKTSETGCFLFVLEKG
jgi:hypothetical protein